VANSSVPGPRSPEKLRGCQKQGTAARQDLVLVKDFLTHAYVSVKIDACEPHSTSTTRHSPRPPG
jgi:hypothetical protein